MKANMSALHIIQLLGLLYFVFCSFAFAGDTTVSGRILTQSGPLDGARVYVYRGYSDIQDGVPVLMSEVVNNQGVYALKLPKGDNYLVARGSRDGKKFFAYHGNNPIKVESEDAWVTLLANEVKPPEYSAGETALEGIVTYKGVPLKGAYVSLYMPDAKKFKGLGFKTDPVESDGSFKFPLPIGKYVVIAKRSEAGKGNWPLKKGDLYCYYPSNPVEVRPDSTTRIEIPCYPKDDRSSFTEIPQVKSGTFKTIDDFAAGVNGGIRGRVTDPNGKPVSGIMVLAYRATKPVFLTYYLSHGTEYLAETDAKGNYFIPVDTSGDYYLVARDTLGDGPHRGEQYGLYNGNNRHSVRYKKGKLLDNVDITATRIMSDTLKGRLPEPAQAKISEAIEKTTEQKAIVVDLVIDKDTTWKGEVLVTGVVLVKKGATLFIEPGTTVRFARIDRDNNGVGDGELRIDGRILAIGTPEKGILFTSAEKKPETKDWSYMHLLASQSDNIFQHCRFEYGFSGMQVHYSKVRISDCMFTNNYEGLHFNTADLAVDHSTFTDNIVAIRFKRVEGKITISNCEIRKNEIGVMFGRQQVNAVDFKNLNRPVEFPSFLNNNFYDNFKYNFYMGNEQNLDIAVAGNWWGTAEAKKIEETIFDKKNDRLLGNIIYEPFLATPFQNAGVRDAQQQSEISK